MYCLVVLKSFLCTNRSVVTIALEEDSFAHDRNLSAERNLSADRNLSLSPFCYFFFFCARKPKVPTSFVSSVDDLFACVGRPNVFCSLSYLFFVCDTLALCSDVLLTVLTAYSLPCLSFFRTKIVYQKVYHKLDDVFAQPKAVCYFELVSPVAYESPKSVAALKLFQLSLDERLNEYTYDAQVW